MIFARVEASRTFVGSLDAQSELVASLAALCKDKGIDCGVIAGYGYLENPVLQRYSRAEKGFIAPQEVEGCFAVPSVQGSISLDDKNQPCVVLFASGSSTGRGRATTFAGQLEGAVVRQFEFTIQTVDNVLLNRLKDRQSGLELWLQMLPAGMAGRPVTSSFDDEVELEERGEDDDGDEEEYFGDEELEVMAGDWLNHPRLGMCHVVQFDGEDRIKVRLQSGRIAELMMTMFRLSLGGVKEGGKVYEVTVRKRS
jgi:predicted DNA-binding protein with PD1-like motif